MHITNEGLKELPDDGRDFPLGGVFGDIDISEVPNETFVVAQPRVIKDQGDSDLCSAYAVTSVSEDQEDFTLLPEYQFYSTKRITGNLEEWGADLRSACKSAVRYGSILSATSDMGGKPRAFVLDSANWPKNIDERAASCKKSTFFAVTGKYDLFDNIRGALWCHKDSKCSIVTGATWKQAWITAENGIIPDVSGDGFGHAFKIFGQKLIDGELYLMAQLSNGTAVGDNGIFYFSRAVANKELGKYGLFMFKDITKEEAEYYLNKPYHIGTPWYKKIWALINSIFYK